MPISRQLRSAIFAALENVSDKLSLVADDSFEQVRSIQAAVNEAQETINRLDRKAEFTPPNRIVFEATRECRYPTGNEFYLELDLDLDHPDLPLAARIHCADDYDGEWGGKPVNYVIYRIVEKESQ